MMWNTSARILILFYLSLLTVPAFGLDVHTVDVVENQVIKLECPLGHGIRIVAWFKDGVDQPIIRYRLTGNKVLFMNSQWFDDVTILSNMNSTIAVRLRRDRDTGALYCVDGSESLAHGQPRVVYDMNFIEAVTAVVFIPSKSAKKTPRTLSTTRSLPTHYAFATNAAQNATPKPQRATTSMTLRTSTKQNRHPPLSLSRRHSNAPRTTQKSMMSRRQRLHSPMATMSSRFTMSVIGVIALAVVALLLLLLSKKFPKFTLPFHIRRRKFRIDARRSSFAYHQDVPSESPKQHVTNNVIIQNMTPTAWD